MTIALILVACGPVLYAAIRAAQYTLPGFVLWPSIERRTI